MKSDITLIRAIGSEFITRKYKSVLLVYVIASIILLALAAWLVSVNVWWWLFAAPAIAVVVAGALLAIVIKMLIKIVMPNITKVQATAVSAFVDKLERVAENVQTPPYIILFRIIRDTLRPRDKTFIQSMAEDSTTLHTDFLALQRKFKLT